MHRHGQEPVDAQQPKRSECHNAEMNLMNSGNDNTEFEEVEFLSIVIDPIPGPETIGPSLDGPDPEVFRHKVRSPDAVSEN